MSTEIEIQHTQTALEQAIAAFQSGDPVLVHDFDDREGETDIIYPASAVDPDDVSRLRNDAGGLICVALPDLVCDTWDLPFAQTVVDHPAAGDDDLGYDERSSFSLTVNHRETFTGITDEDRALTISALGVAASTVEHARTIAGESAEASVVPDAHSFAETFRTPGHVHLLRAAPSLLEDRRGHTELGLALADAAGVDPAVVVCEMLDDETGDSLSKTDARQYAHREGLSFLRGEQIVRSLA